jgi:hypothetical protein
MTIHTIPRPYLLVCEQGPTFLLSATEAQRLIDSADEGLAITNAAPNRVRLASSDGTRSSLIPATLGGGPAFEVTSAENYGPGKLVEAAKDALGSIMPEED